MQSKMFSLRDVAVSLMVLVGLVIVLQNARAAEQTMLTVQQVSPTEQMGTWILRSAKGGLVFGNQRGVPERSLAGIEPGTYILDVDPPRRAKTTISVYREIDLIETEELLTSQSNQLTFSIPDGATIRIIVSYEFSGEIEVLSDPPGAPFTIQGSNNIQLNGVTPSIFRDVPPVYYVTHFGVMDECLTPRHQSRQLSPNASLTFYGIYHCGTNAMQSSSTPPPAAAPVITVAPAPRAGVQAGDVVDIRLSANQNEVLPGSTVDYSLSVRNEGHQTLQGLTVSLQFDPTEVTVIEAEGARLVSDGLLVWRGVSIPSGRNWMEDFTVETSHMLATGHKVDLSVRVGGDSLVEAGTAEENLLVSHTIGIAFLPETGARTDALFVLFLALAAGVPTFAFTTRRKKRVAPITA